MQFRFMGEVPLRLTTTEGGHSVIIGKKWREVPDIFQADALAKGAERQKDGKVPVPAKSTATGGAGDQNDHDAAYREALTTMITRDVKGDFTSDHLPNIAVVSKLSGLNAKKEDVYRIFRAMKDEAENPTG